MRPSAIVTALLLVPAAHAAPEAPALLPTPVARAMLERDPSVAAARSLLEMARAEAGILERSPYEWTARLSSQRRSIESGPRHNEWNATLERPWRLPAKATADANLARATLVEGEARVGEALHRVARELASSWLDWLGAESARDLAKAMQAAAQANLDAVTKRLRAGDASKLDVSLAQGDLAEQQRSANEAETQASVARARLQARFPGIAIVPTPLAAPVPLMQGFEYWRGRILQQSDDLKLAEAQWHKSRAQAERARAERIPDPTVGLYTGSELGGQERIVGLSVSIPIPGGQRSLRADRAVHSVEAARQEVEQKRLQLEAEVAAAVATAQGSFRGVQIAEEGARAMQEAAQLMQRAYSLGEADLQSLLTARRQAAAAANSALGARVAALKAYYALLIDAHLVWDLDHE